MNHQPLHFVLAIMNQEPTVRDCLAAVLLGGSPFSVERFASNMECPTMVAQRQQIIGNTEL